MVKLTCVVEMQCLRTDKSRYHFNHNELFETPCLSLCVAKGRKLVAAMYRKKKRALLAR